MAIHPGALGDVLVAVPALRAFRRQDVLILAAQPHVGTLLVALGVARETVDFETLGLDALFADDSTRTPRLPPAARIVCWFGARDPQFVRRLRARAPEAVVAPSTGRSPVWRHLLDSVGGRPDEWCAPVTVPTELRAVGARRLREGGWDGTAPLVMAHVGASSVAKRWMPSAYAAVLNEVTRHAMVALHAGPLDDDAVDAVRARLHVPPLLLRRPPLPELAGALSHVATFVGNDSGIGHLAAAVGLPAVIVHDPRHAAFVPWSASALPIAVPIGAACRDDIERVSTALRAALDRVRAA